MSAKNAAELRHSCKKCAVFLLQTFHKSSSTIKESDTDDTESTAGAAVEDAIAFKVNAREKPLLFAHHGDIIHHGQTAKQIIERRQKQNIKKQVFYIHTLLNYTFNRELLFFTGRGAVCL